MTDDCRIKRVFIGVKIGGRLAGEITAWDERVKTRFAKNKQPTGAVPRWIAPHNLHLTLIPPWYEEAPDDVAEKMRRALSSPKGAAVSPFDVFFTRVLFGPNPKRPRLIWAEGETPRAMLELKDVLEAALQKEGEKRPYKLHLTLARFRPEHFSSFPIKELDEPVFWQENVNAVTFFESCLHRSGAEYAPLAEVPFLHA